MNDERTHGDHSAVDDGGDGEGTVVMSMPQPCLVPIEQYAPALLGEECAETAHMAFKGARFGLDHARADGLTARRGMSIEAGDVIAAIAFNLRAGTLDGDVMLERAGAKFRRLTNPHSRDDEGRSLAPTLPETHLNVRERLATWPVLETLSSTHVNETMTEALLLIELQRSVLAAAATQFRFYEREHNAKGDAVMKTHEVESMKKVRAEESYAKARRNAEYAARCEGAIDV